MPVFTYIAFRFLTHNKLQSFLISLGIAVGVAVQMFVGLLIDSLQSNLITRTVGNSAHITIEPHEKGKFLKFPEQLTAKVNKIPAISRVNIVADAPAIVYGRTEDYSVVFRGLDRNSQDIYGIQRSLVDGKYFRSVSDIVIGEELALELGVKPGGSIEIGNGNNKKSVFRVTGVFRLGSTATDRGWVIADIRTVQNYFDLGKSATAVVMQVSDVFAADSVKKTLVETINDPSYEIRSWKETNAQLLNALSSQSSSSFMIQFFVLLSVLIAISSILSMTVLQKSRQIGILKAMGLSDIDASKIFIGVSFILGLIGASLGTIFGFFLFFGFIGSAKGTDGAPLFTPVIRWMYVGVTWVITIMAATVAGLIPARKSASLSPIEIIQN